MSIKQKQLSYISNSRVVIQSFYSKQFLQTAEMTKSRSISISQSRSKVNDLFETNQTCGLTQFCPSCLLKTSKIVYYSCCLLPACQSCYAGFHYLQCPKKPKNGKYNQVIGHLNPLNDMKTHRTSYLIKCQRCQQKIGNHYYSCTKCKLNYVCEKCCNSLHKTSKFKVHNFKKNQKDKSNTNSSIDLIVSNNQPNILICQAHNKIRNMLTQSFELLCSQCFGNIRQKNTKIIQYQGQNTLNILKTQIQQLSLDLNSRQIHHRNKWSELRLQLRQQFNKIYQIILERYQQNQIALNQMQQYDKNIINKALKQSSKAITQCLIDYKQMGIPKELAIARLNIVYAQLLKSKTNVLNSQLFIYKVNGTQFQRLQSLIKNFTISKLKLRQTQQNMSMKKSQKSSINPNQCNLSISRRSLSKSISKIQNSRNSIVKEHSSIPRSQNLSQQVCTQPLRNATPPQIKTQISSDKKSAILRQNSLMNAKLQDITPVALNFDLKQTNGSRINFMSNKTEDYSQNAINQNNISSQSRTSKRKSDYFQLRDRIRKPNMVNNRFSKR